MKKMRVLYLLLCAYSYCIAQTPVLDSLKKVLKNTQIDTVKCNLLVLMAESETDDAIWPKYNEQAFVLATEKLKTEKSPVLVKFYNTKLGQCYINKGYYEQFLNENSTKALVNYNKAVELLKSVNSLKGLSSVYNNIGSVYENIGDVRKAIDYYNQALVCEEKSGGEDVALPLNNIGMIFHRQKDYKNAIKYYIKSIDISKRQQNPHGIAYASNNLGLTYQSIKNYKLAESYFKAAIYNWESISNKRMLSYAFNNLGCLYLVQGKLVEAKAELDKSYAIAVELNDSHVQAYTDLNYAKIALMQKEIGKAEKLALKALDLSKRLAYPENIRDVSLILSQVYEMAKKPEKAFALYELHIRMRDSLNNAEIKKASIKADVKYEFDKKAIADSVKVVEEKRLTNEQLKYEKTQRNVLYSGLGLVGLFALFMVNRFIVISRQKKLIDSQKQIVEEQKNILEVKQKEIMDSIHYAKRIQQSHLPSEKYVSSVLKRLKNKG